MVVISHGYGAWAPKSRGVWLGVAERLGPPGIYLLFPVSGFVLYRPMVAARHGEARACWGGSG